MLARWLAGNPSRLIRSRMKPCFSRSNPVSSNPGSRGCAAALSGVLGLEPAAAAGGGELSAEAVCVELR
jgi:hypothetical protein